MHLLEQYINAINLGDPDRMASIFHEECYFDDGGGRLVGKPDIVAKNREQVKNAFTAIFQRVQLEAKLIKLNLHSMEYDIISNGHINQCVGLMTEKDGKILEYIVRPR